LLDELSTAILVQTLAGEDTGSDNDTFNTRWNAQGSITDIAGFFTEDGPQEFLFRRELSLTFRRNLTNQDIGRLDFSTNTDDTALVEIAQCILAKVGNIVSNLFLSQFGVTGDALEFLDVYRGVTVFLDQLLGDQDRVLKVVWVDGPSAMISPRLTLSPTLTIGFWLRQVF
jgi:hypothetical protein